MRWKKCGKGCVEMIRKLILLGGGGHCKSVLDSLLSSSNFSEIGIVDKKEVMGTDVLGVPVFGCDDDLAGLLQQGYTHAFVTLGNIGNPSARKKLFMKIEQIGFIIPSIIDSSANVSKYANIEAGVFIGKNAVVNGGSVIGKGAIVNTSSIIEHDCVIEEFVNISPGAVICGGVHIGSDTYIGAGSVIKQQVKIGPDSVIGMGSIVLKDIEGNTLAYGNPCREVKKL